MRVMFDSNVWRKIAIPEDNNGDMQYDALCKIHDAIIDGRIEAFLSENIFTLENIPRCKCKDKVGSLKSKFETSVTTERNKVAATFTLGPDPNDAVSLDDTEFLRIPTDTAINMGFHIVRFPRIGGLTNKDIEPFLYDVGDFDAFYNKATEVEERIEGIGAGFSQIEKLVGQSVGRSIIEKIHNAPENIRKKIAAGIAEWVDGDAVATSIGLGCDFFCTRDEAKSAGPTSVFSVVNLTWLKDEYNFIVKKPEEIAAML